LPANLKSTRIFCHLSPKLKNNKNKKEMLISTYWRPNIHKDGTEILGVKCKLELGYQM
jgi:hypothetical protein